MYLEEAPLMETICPKRWLVVEVIRTILTSKYVVIVLDILRDNVSTAFCFELIVFYSPDPVTCVEVMFIRNTACGILIFRRLTAYVCSEFRLNGITGGYDL